MLVIGCGSRAAVFLMARFQSTALLVLQKSWIPLATLSGMPSLVCAREM